MKARLFGALLCIVLLLAVPALANTVGHVFLTGHDPDYHATVGGNTTGARNIILDGVNYATGGVAIDSTHRILYVTDTRNPGGDQFDGRVTMGNIFGGNFDVADDGTAGGTVLDLNTVNFSNYAAIVISSDYGSWLRQSELDILNTRKNDIGSYLLNGGGLVAFAEGGDRAVPPGTYPGTSHDRYGYLPAVVASAALNQTEIGNTVTAFGMSLGLAASDVNGNASHNIFTSTGGLNIVDMDSSREILTLAGEYNPTLTNPVPEPASLMLFGSGMAGLGWIRRRARK